MTDKDIRLFIYNELKTAIATGAMSPEDRLWIFDGREVLSAKSNISPDNISIDDLSSMDLDEAAQSSDMITRVALSVHQKHRNLKVLLLSRSIYSKTVSMTGETLKPYVDDVAQIIGIDIKNIPVSHTKKITALFKSRSAVTIKGEGILCAGPTFDEAVAVAIIAEKAALIHVRGSFIGHLNFIGKFESALMRFVYLKKYSKQAEAVTGRDK